MHQKYYVWGFPGIGKSSVNSDLRIADADCEWLKFLVPENAPLHSREVMEHTQRDPSYPDNYWNYVRAVDADIVLLNCHISLLGTVDRERLLLVYPAPDLKEEYLRRYAQRGDNESYIRYMESAFDEIVAAVKHSPYRKYEVTDPHIYLQNLADKKAQLEQERILDERRGGLSHKELSRRIMEGIVNGALDIRHCEAAPYSHGFEVTFRAARKGIGTRWTCFCPLPQVAEQIADQIERGSPSVNTSALLEDISYAEKNKIRSFVLECNSGLQRRSQYTGHVASAQDVHRGIALDGIIQGHFQGDYSSITTGTQNDTVRALVALKGFCLDCVHTLPSRSLVQFVIDYLKDHGTDISTPEKLNAWIRKNPRKCALPENRERAPARSKAEPTATAKEKKRKNNYER